MSANRCEVAAWRRRKVLGSVESVVDGAGALRGPWNAQLHSPLIGQHLEALGTAVRTHNSLPARVYEIGILTVGAKWRSNFEWFAHAPIAAKAGVGAAAIAAIKRQASPDFVAALGTPGAPEDQQQSGGLDLIGSRGEASGGSGGDGSDDGSCSGGSCGGGLRLDELAAYRYCFELTHSARVGDATFAAAVAALGERGVVDLTFTMGCYHAVSLSLNAFNVALPTGNAMPFPDDDDDDDIEEGSGCANNERSCSGKKHGNVETSNYRKENRLEK